MSAFELFIISELKTENSIRKSTFYRPLAFGRLKEVNN